ncbi:hypothetical protein ACFDR9_005608 [Janthinobacterium sp. CG_23.3]|uniref:hypothetical protein n=1 Tax=Janthinobacterium sp. CG_23.3 TaxID=3349634 RepID=UPI0038D4ED93
MTKVTLNSLFLSLFALSLSNLTGWLLTEKIATPQAGASFLYIGIPITLTIFIYQTLFFRGAQKKLFSYLMYWGSFGFTLGWLMFCFFIPLFWADSIATMTKTSFFGIIAIICGANILIALRIVDRKWKDVGATEFENRFRLADSTVEWDKVVKKMEIRPKIYLPGVPESWTNAVSILMVVLAFLGVILRVSYPIFSAFAWGIPFSIVAAFFLQVGAYIFAQACKVRTFEKNKNMTVKSTI